MSSGGSHAARACDKKIRRRPCEAAISDKTLCWQGNCARQQIRKTLERDAKKWVPVFRKNHAKTKTLEHDAILSYRIML
jgi:hypothetical protein